MLVMAAPIKPIAAVDVPLPELLGRTARMAAVYTLAVARLTKPKGSHDLVAYALDIRLIEADADVAVDADYPAWAAALADQPTYFRATEAS